MGNLEVMKCLFGLRFVPVLVAAFAFAGCAGLIRDRIYKPVPIAQTPVSFAGEAPKPVSVTSPDELQLEGYYWPAATGNDTLVVYFHGNGFNQLVGARRAEPLKTGGHGVLVASYRGYGGNPGKPSEQGLISDAEAWMAKARELAPESRLYLFGHSLGGAVALKMAARHPLAGVATLGTFARLADVAPPIARKILPDRFDNLQTISRVKAPIYLLHGTNDQIVPFAAAARLQKASGGRAVVVPLRDAGHHIPLDKIAPRVWDLLSSKDR